VKKSHSFGRIALLSALLGTTALVPDPAFAQVTGNILEEILISASPLDAQNIGGSVQVITPADIDRFSYSDVNRVLRQAPGIYIQEEEGFGLRPNIGLRGSGSDRSSRIALMEDGVLISPAPYAAPAAYYFPTMSRIAGVEISKGPAAIKYGPLTTGGAINLFSTAIPQEFGIRVSAEAGSYESRRIHGAAGGFRSSTGGINIGGLIEGVFEETSGFKELDGGGDAGYGIEDVVAKLALRTATSGGVQHAVELKMQHSHQNSDETYLGLSLADFQANPYRRYRGSQIDNIDVNHWLYQGTYRVDLRDGLALTTTAYRTDTTRAWYKLNDVRNGGTTFVALNAVLDEPAAFPVAYANLIGASGFVSANDALRVRNNNREYYTQGVQSVLSIDFATGGAMHEIEVSGRYHEDAEDRYQDDDRYRMDNGTMIMTTDGAPGSQDNRVGSAKAWSFFLRDQIGFGAFTFVPGVRYETIELTQENFGTTDPERTGASLSVSERSVDIWLPGVSGTWNVSPGWTLLAGVHRGFSNPAPGSTVDFETSTNWEAGFRYAEGALYLESIGFFSDYDNLIGTCTASTGGGCTIGAQFAGGAVNILGLETMVQWDAGAMLGTSLQVPISLVHTWTDAEFQTSFASAFAPWGTVTAGDKLPHLPEHQWTLGIGVGDGTNRIDLLANYVSETRETAGSGAIAANDRIDSRVIFDIAGKFELTDGLFLKGRVENLFDDVYNVSFSPAGARPGKPQTFWIGMEVNI